MKYEKEIAFAARIKNIPRFYQKEAWQFVKDFEKLLERYFDLSVLYDLVKSSIENPSVYQSIVQYAVDISLYETDTSKGEGKKNKNLTSVFCRITAGEEKVILNKEYAFEELSTTSCFPKEREKGKTLEQMKTLFITELKELEKSQIDNNYEIFLTIFDSISQKYMWCVTASDYEGEDISLYDQSRIAMAVAGCLARCNEDILKKNSEDFKLVVGDFSGIQKYIFSVAKTSESGVAKRLRARSFYVDVTVEVVAHALIEKFQLSNSHILMLTGGKFYLLLPNTENSEQLMEENEKEMEEFFYEKFKGQIAINLAWINIGAEGLRDYSRSIVELSRLLRKKKNTAFQSVLTHNGKWEEDKFVLFNELKDKSICHSCKADLTAKEEKEKLYCENCKIQTEIGRLLPDTQFISYYKTEHPGTYRIYKNYFIGLWKKPRKDDAYLIEQLNITNQFVELQGLPLGYKFMANYIPLDTEGTIMTFENIAKESEGMEKLAVLKADVDNLGYLFADGFRTKDRHLGTISRVHTMSRLLENFFSGYIHELLIKKYRNVYSVFSGGDDLFLIGPWNVMAEVAIKLQEEFTRFAVYNPALTISATINIFSRREHIAVLAIASEETLKQVKETSILELKKPERNGVYFLNQIFAWDDFKQQLEIGKKIARLLKENKIDVNMVRRIKTYSQMYRDFLIKKDVFALMFQPLFYYDKSRNYPKIKKIEDIELKWFLEEYTRYLEKNTADIRQVKKDLYFAKETMEYSLYLTRKERGNV